MKARSFPEFCIKMFKLFVTYSQMLIYIKKRLTIQEKVAKTLSQPESSRKCHFTIFTIFQIQFFPLFFTQREWRTYNFIIRLIEYLCLASTSNFCSLSCKPGYLALLTLIFTKSLPKPLHLQITCRSMRNMYLQLLGTGQRHPTVFKIS